MGKRQTRRTISMKGLTYQRVRKYCAANERTMSGFLEELVAERLDALGVPQEEVLEPRETTRPRRRLEGFQGSTFTF